MHEFNTLCKSLNQDLDYSKAKGSHKKLTLAFNAEIKKQVLTLTNSIFLKEYQIKRMRESFVKARIIPNNDDIITKLKENFPEYFKNLCS